MLKVYEFLIDTLFFCGEAVKKVRLPIDFVDDGKIFGANFRILFSLQVVF